MAAGGEEKTEEPTAKKQNDARKKGNIPKSRDLAAAMLFLVGLTLLRYIGPWMAWHTKIFFEMMILEQMPNLEIPEKKEIIPYAVEWFMWLGMLVGPFLFLLFVTAYLVHYYQVGWIITTEPFKFNPNKINPVAGFKRIFSTRNIVMLVMNLAKLSVILGVSWFVMNKEISNVAAMLDMEIMGSFVHTCDKIIDLAQTLSILLMILGFTDFKYQKWKHNKDLKMTKQEVKEEYKQMEGDPMIKSKRRQKAMELAQQRMMNEVPQAEVVVRNPTHFAVAISYKPGMAAPLVVAKGADHVAMQIIEIAREHGVPLVENPPLARELYKKVEVGQVIPQELFAVVAEILASVLNKKKLEELMVPGPEAA